ncbi:nuclear transport factor 2 family protein [Shewanella khirikhana]|uniref:nuclear transport factor 2 family protein n=1 Tax=Shewanella khirikhana TaxID=1965282 RepID=UPI0030CC7080
MNAGVHNPVDSSAFDKRQQTSDMSLLLSAPIEKLIGLYQKLGANNLELLDEVYGAEVIFCDPMHRVEGIAALKAYFANLYQNLGSIDFEFHRVMDDGRHAMLVWTMTFTHPRLAAGKPISVEGVSQIDYSDKVDFHRDYFDVGAMLYEHIPGLGALVRLVKRRAGK